MRRLLLATALVTACAPVADLPLAREPERSTTTRPTRRLRIHLHPTTTTTTTTAPVEAELASDMPAVLVAIAECESGGDYRAVSPSGKYRGAYQFDRQTFAAVGGSGDPAAASPAEQDKRAAILFDRRGPAPWPVCG